MYKVHSTAQNYRTYAKLRNQVNYEVREAKKNKELTKDAKHNHKALFQYMSSKTKPKETIPDLLKSDGNYTEGNKEKANILNSFFGRLFIDARHG